MLCASRQTRDRAVSTRSFLRAWNIDDNYKHIHAKHLTISVLLCALIVGSCISGDGASVFRCFFLFLPLFLRSSSGDCCCGFVSGSQDSSCSNGIAANGLRVRGRGGCNLAALVCLVTLLFHCWKTNTCQLFPMTCQKQKHISRHLNCWIIYLAGVFGRDRAWRYVLSHSLLWFNLLDGFNRRSRC